jgi:hypothetical protein
LGASDTPLASRNPHGVDALNVGSGIAQPIGRCGRTAGTGQLKTAADPAALWGYQEFARYRPTACGHDYCRTTP